MTAPAATLSALRALLIVSVAAFIPLVARAEIIANPDVEIVIRTGDTLIGLGKRLLNDPATWPLVQRNNHIRDPYHLQPGSRLRIPLNLLASVPVSARVLAQSGSVRFAGPPGPDVVEGATITTGADGFASLQLADGTVLRVAANSAVEVERLRRLTKAQRLETVVRVDAGRVDLKAQPQGDNRFVIRTRVSAATVRGTAFGVGTLADLGVVTDVVEGKVAVDGAAAQSATRTVAAGQGNRVDASGMAAAPVALLPATDFAAASTLQERTTLRFPFAEVRGAAGYLAEVARDASFNDTLAAVTVAAPPARFSGLPDGTYFVRVKAIDGNGIPGFPADQAFQLRARPEPPLPMAPGAAAKVRSEHATLRWTEVPQAEAYRVQVFSAAATLLDRTVKNATELDLGALKPGVYRWRLATVEAGEHQGPFSDAQDFVQLLPQQSPGEAQLENGKLHLNWVAEPGQTFHVQIAGDAAFTRLASEAETREPGMTLPAMPSGIYYVRVRATDADGFVGDYSAPRRFEVESNIVDASGNPVSTSTSRLRGSQ